MKVLVVDDCEDSSQLLEIILAMHGHQVCTAPNGIEALRMAQSESFEAAVLDIALPELDGFEVAARLRERYPELLRIAVTGWAPQTVSGEMVARFDHYLVKPIEVDHLVELLSQARAARASAQTCA